MLNKFESKLKLFSICFKKEVPHINIVPTTADVRYFGVGITNNKEQDSEFNRQHFSRNK